MNGLLRFRGANILPQGDADAEGACGKLRSLGLVPRRRSLDNPCMSDPSRRDFLKSVPRTCVLVPLMTQATGHAFESSPRTPQIENDFVAVLFDADTGRLDIWRLRGDVLLAGAVARAVTAQGLRSTSEPAYEHSVERSPCAIAWGTDGN